jgi:NADH-quinone oxidoreductase subunit G
MIGSPADLTFPVEMIGAGTESLRALAAGQGSFAEVLRAAERPMIIVGMGALSRPDGAAVLALTRKLAEDFGMLGEDWNGFNILHTAAARVGGLDLGFLPGAGGRDLEGILGGAENGEIEAVYLLGADEIDMGRLGKAFVIYQGHHGDAGAHRADVILPGAAYTEKNGTYVNTEGRVQIARLACFPPGDAREDWTILRALSGLLERTLPYDNLGELRAKMIDAQPNFAQVDQVVPAVWGAFGRDGPLNDAPFVPSIENFYMTCPISRVSETMAQCTEAFVLGKAEATGTDG